MKKFNSLSEAIEIDENYFRTQLVHSIKTISNGVWALGPKHSIESYSINGAHNKQDYQLVWFLKTRDLAFFEVPVDTLQEWWNEN